MRYTDLIFDLYGTLVDIHTEESDEVWAKTALYFGYYGAAYTAESLKTDFKSEMTRRESAEGQSYEVFPDIPIEGVMADLFRRKGVVEQADTLGLNAAQVFRIASTEYIRLYDGVLDALHRLRSHGYRLWLLSNAQRTFTAYELRHLGLGSEFDGIYLSSDYRCRKPDLRFFRALIEDHRLIPASCLMIGNDRETDIAGAKNAGLDTLYMHTNLTPSHQAAAAPDLLPCRNSTLRDFEFEGADWALLSGLLCSI